MNNNVTNKNIATSIRAVNEDRQTSSHLLFCLCIPFLTFGEGENGLGVAESFIVQLSWELLIFQDGHIQIPVETEQTLDWIDRGTDELVRKKTNGENKWIGGAGWVSHWRHWHQLTCMSATMIAFISRKWGSLWKWWIDIYFYGKRPFLWGKLSYGYIKGTIFPAFVISWISWSVHLQNYLKYCSLLFQWFNYIQIKNYFSCVTFYSFNLDLIRFTFNA